MYYQPIWLATILFIDIFDLLLNFDIKFSNLLNPIYIGKPIIQNKYHQLQTK